VSSNNVGKGKGGKFNSIMTRTPGSATSLSLTNKTIKGAIILKLSSLVPNFQQVRQHFDAEALAELAEDIKARGIIEPLIVRELANEPETYEIIAGERRYRAAQQAGLEEVPVIVRELNDHDARFLMLAENLQRQDLDPRDEQRFFQVLQTEFNLSKTDIARLVNKSRAYVSEMIDGKYPTLKTLKTSIIDELNKNSQSAPSESERPVPALAKPFRYNPRIYRRVSSFFDDTLTALDSPTLEEATLGQIEQDIADAETRLSSLRTKLAALRNSDEKARTA